VTVRFLEIILVQQRLTNISKCIKLKIFWENLGETSKGGGREKVLYLPYEFQIFMVSKKNPKKIIFFRNVIFEKTKQLLNSHSFIYSFIHSHTHLSTHTLCRLNKLPAMFILFVLCPAYGMTECTGQISRRSIEEYPHECPVGSVGLIVPHMQLKVKQF